MKAFRKQLVGLPGIGPQKAQWIIESGVRSRKKLMSMSKNQLASLKGVGPELAGSIYVRLHGKAAEKPRKTGTVPAPAPADPPVAPAAAGIALRDRIAVEIKGVISIFREIVETLIILAGDRCLGAGSAHA